MRVGILLGLIILMGIAGCESQAQARRKKLLEDARQLGLAHQNYAAQYAGPARKPASE